MKKVVDNKQKLCYNIYVRSRKGNIMSSSLKKYLIEIGQYPLLNAEQELELGKRIADGDAAARETLINSNLRLVVYIAKNYKNTQLPLEDLIAEGNFGLITAADKYDYKLGYRFSTCATPWIKQAILKAITDKGKMIRLPAHVYAQLNKMRDVINEFATEGNLAPTDEEIAARMGVDVSRIGKLQHWRRDTISLHTPLGDEDKNTIEDLIPDNDTETPVEYTEKSLRHAEIQKVLSKYPERTRVIMKMRYGLGTNGDPAEYFQEHTLEQIGAYLGITRERVRQIEKETLQDMRNTWPL